MRLYLSSYRMGNKPEELLKLLAGKKRTALIGNATDYRQETERGEHLTENIDELEALGLEVVEIDLREYFGKIGDLRSKLEEVDLIWVRGGNAFILLRAFEQSGAGQIIKDLLVEDKVVYGGYSAGIDMLTPSLHGVELVDDPNSIPEGYKPDVLWDSLSILPYAIAPHYKSDHPESEAIDKSIRWMIDNHIPFIALKDGEVIIRNGDKELIVS